MEIERPIKFHFFHMNFIFIKSRESRESWNVNSNMADNQVESSRNMVRLLLKQNRPSTVENEWKAVET